MSNERQHFSSCRRPESPSEFQKENKTASTLVCLSFEGYFTAAERMVQEKFGLHKCILLDMRRIVSNPVLFFRFARMKPDTVVAFISDIEHGDALDVAGFLVAICGGRHKLITDFYGRTVEVGLRGGVGFFTRLILDLVSIPYVLIRANLKGFFMGRIEPARISRGSGREIYYLRTDLLRELKSGGSVAHTTGVLSGFLKLGWEPVYYGYLRMGSLDALPISKIYIPRIRLMRNVPELPNLIHSEYFSKAVLRNISGKKPSFIYQRYSLGNYSGVLLSRKLKVPLVLEFNGSEIWVARNWGTPLFFETLAEKIEAGNLAAAKIVVVVSKVLKNELVRRGVAEHKILVNPNGVDGSKYNPYINGTLVRKKYGLERKTVIGFIGTFGRWHGAEVLASAVSHVSKEADDAHFLFIGDGVTFPEVKRILKRDGTESRVTLTGQIPQDEAPLYLAACDIFVSPHVPNPDGTPFFGSPTKLFEYMAMGRAIVASDLAQIGEVLENEKTALMVRPGDEYQLAEAVSRLIRDKELRARLGRNAGTEAVEKYTWTRHVEKIIAFLGETG